MANKQDTYIKRVEDIQKYLGDDYNVRASEEHYINKDEKIIVTKNNDEWQTNIHLSLFKLSDKLHLTIDCGLKDNQKLINIEEFIKNQKLTCTKFGISGFKIRVFKGAVLTNEVLETIKTNAILFKSII